MASHTVFLKIGACAAAVFLIAGQSGASTQPAPRCSAYATALWANGPSPKLRVEAFSDGPTCAKAVTVFVVRDATGRVLLNETYESQFVMPLVGANTRTQLQAGLREWVDVSRASNPHRTLPNWASGAPAPTETEFGFTTDESITRADYLAIKANRTPILCYIQGLESLNCSVFRNGGLEPFGIQAFPG